MIACKYFQDSTKNKYNLKKQTANITLTLKKAFYKTDTEWTL